MVTAVPIVQLAKAACGAFDSGSSAQHEFVTVSGIGSLNVSNTAGNLQVWIGSGAVSGSQATLDLSALDNFNTAVSRFLVGATIGNTVNRPSGIVYLAKTNSITAGFQTTTITNGSTTANAGLVVADCNQNNGSASFIYLGQVNTISADTIAEDKGAKEEKETFYRVTVRTEINHLGTAENPLPIIPGMIATVEILTGQKTVLDYLIKPARMLRDEALRER